MYGLVKNGKVIATSEKAMRSPEGYIIKLTQENFEKIQKSQEASIDDNGDLQVVERQESNEDKIVMGQSLINRIKFKKIIGESVEDDENKLVDLASSIIDSSDKTKAQKKTLKQNILSSIS